MTDLLSSVNVKQILLTVVHNLSYGIICLTCLEQGFKEVLVRVRNQHLAGRELGMGGVLFPHLDEASVMCFSETGFISKSLWFQNTHFVKRRPSKRSKWTDFLGSSSTKLKRRMENSGKGKFYTKLDCLEIKKRREKVSPNGVWYLHILLITIAGLKTYWLLSKCTSPFAEYWLCFPCGHMNWVWNAPT